jgi:hypothetical protein
MAVNFIPIGFRTTPTCIPIAFSSDGKLVRSYRFFELYGHDTESDREGTCDAAVAGPPTLVVSPY